MENWRSIIGKCTIIKLKEQEKIIQDSSRQQMGITKCCYIDGAQRKINDGFVKS